MPQRFGLQSIKESDHFLSKICDSKGQIIEFILKMKRVIENVYVRMLTRKRLTAQAVKSMSNNNLGSRAWILNPHINKVSYLNFYQT